MRADPIYATACKDQIRQMEYTYRIQTEPLKGRITAWRDGIILASSTRALVVYETRMEPVIYFPFEDIVAPLSDPTELQTFCPFKGTARYQDINLPQETLRNGVWSYQSSLPESRDIHGYGAFAPGILTDLDMNDNELRQNPTANISGPLVDWLLREAAFLKTPEDFTGALAGKLIEHGVHISRLSVMLWSLHPMIAGKNFIWEKSAKEITVYAPSYDIHDHPSFRKQPTQIRIKRAWWRSAKAGHGR